MLPGGITIYKCPHCGGEKNLLCLASGNTFGMKMWSDTKRYAPMLPEIAYVQKCPHCGRYFTTTQSESRMNHEGVSFETGYLEYEDMKAALHQFVEQGFTDERDEFSIRLSFVWAYNDAFNRNGQDSGQPTDEDKKLHQANIERILALSGPFSGESGDILKAELMREAGYYDACLIFMSSTKEPKDEFLLSIWNAEKEHAEQKDSAVFSLY